MLDMRCGAWLGGVMLIVGACSDGGQRAADTGVGGGGGRASFDGGPPSQATDTSPSNPHATTMPPVSPNGPTVTVPSGGPGAGGATGAAGNGTADNAGAGGAPSLTGGAGPTGAAGATGAGGTTVSAGAAGASGVAGASAAAGATGTAGATGAADATGAAGAGGMTAAQRSWPTADCVGGPCAAPNVCVNLDFLFVACVPCGGEDQVCCPPYATTDPFLGTCDAGLVCDPNPNFQSPADLVRNVCQVPGSPPPADGKLNHERLKLFP